MVSRLYLLLLLHLKEITYSDSSFPDPKDSVNWLFDNEIFRTRLELKKLREENPS